MTELVLDSVASVVVVIIGMFFGYLLYEFCRIGYELYTAINKLNDSVRLLRISFESWQGNIKKLN